MDVLVRWSLHSLQAISNVVQGTTITDQLPDCVLPIQIFEIENSQLNDDVWIVINLNEINQNNICVSYHWILESSQTSSKVS